MTAPIQFTVNLPADVAKDVCEWAAIHRVSPAAMIAMVCARNSVNADELERVERECVDANAKIVVDA
jgi:hypothetical protein